MKTPNFKSSLPKKPIVFILCNKYKMSIFFLKTQDFQRATLPSNRQICRGFRLLPLSLQGSLVPGPEILKPPLRPNLHLPYFVFIKVILSFSNMDDVIVNCILK